MSFLVQVIVLLAVFGAVSLIAKLAGAESLGTALGFGQIAFVLALMVLLMRR